MYHPIKKEFIEKTKTGNLIPVYKEIIADTQTPVSAYKQIAHGDKFSFLLESVERGEQLGRYSFIGTNPEIVFKCKNNKGSIFTRHKKKQVSLPHGPLPFLRDMMSKYKFAINDSLPSFCGGAVGYFGYDVIRFIEKLPIHTTDDLNLPDCVLMFTDTIVIFDHLLHKMKIVSNVHLNDKTDPSNNPCVDSRFPAASIFKIVTASAVVEKCGFQPGSKLSYNGRKHTLYKSQLKDRRNRYTNRITFRDSFAQSVNPVFGKIGAHYLGKNTLEKYAEAFDFNKNINFEIEIAPSFVDLSDEPYQWAEIACGFNNKTKISPLHGAMMASAIINQGSIMEPTVVDQIIDEKGKIIYRNRLVTINQAITPKASNILNQLMATTIRSGTGKKAFRGYRKDKILSKLNIGGKTGSIDNKSHDARYDWFVGFAEQKDGPRKIAVSVIVAHEKYIGLRAGYYARIAIKKYFFNYFEKTAT